MTFPVDTHPNYYLMVSDYLTMAMAGYHTLPGASLAQPNFLSFGSSTRGYELMLEQARNELSQEWDLAVEGVNQNTDRQPHRPTTRLVSTATCST